MTNSKKTNLVKFIQGINNEGIIDVIEEIFDSKLFSEKVAEKTGLMPIWIVYEIHISQLGNRLRLSIKKAFRNKKNLADFLLSESMSGRIPVFETEVVFIKENSEKVYYAKRKNNLGYYNFDCCFLGEAEANNASKENIMVEKTLIE